MSVPVGLFGSSGLCYNRRVRFHTSRKWYNLVKQVNKVNKTVSSLMKVLSLSALNINWTYISIDISNL
jgi:hypothetical protein